MALPWCGSPLSGWSWAEAADAANEPHRIIATQALARTREWTPDPAIELTPTTEQKRPRILRTRSGKCHRPAKTAGFLRHHGTPEGPGGGRSFLHDRPDSESHRSRRARRRAARRRY